MLWIFLGGEEVTPNLGKSSTVLYPVVFVISSLNFDENILKDLSPSLEKNVGDF